MARPSLAPDIVRKTIALQSDLWADVAEYRHNQRIGTEAEALRRLILAGLASEAVHAPAAPKARKPGGKT